MNEITTKLDSEIKLFFRLLLSQGSLLPVLRPSASALALNGGWSPPQLQGTQTTIWCPYQVSAKDWDLTHLAENHCWCETRCPMILYHLLSTRIPMLEESLTSPY